jgi:hypothetical protein
MRGILWRRGKRIKNSKVKIKKGKRPGYHVVPKNMAKSPVILLFTFEFLIPEPPATRIM